MGYENLFILNLYSSLFLKPVFCVNGIGINFLNPKINIARRAQYHSIDKLFSNMKFFKFYNLLMPEMTDINWHADRVGSWNREDWRMYVIKTLFADFNSLKEMLRVTDGNLASHISALEKKEFIVVFKKFVGKKPNTTYSITRTGKKAFTEHLDALEKLIRSELNDL